MNPARETGGPGLKPGLGRALRPEGRGGAAATVLLAGALLAAAAGAAVAQTDGQIRALELERQGRYEEAAAVYRELLAPVGANVTALLGLERVLGALDRLASIQPYLAAALRDDPDNPLIREIQFRVAERLGGADSVAVIARRWMAAAPHDVEPYRQWAFWLARRGDLDSAKAVLAEGRTRLRDPSLAHYAAQIHASSGDWLEAARLWRAAAAANESFVASAAVGLRHAPDQMHHAILRMYLGDRGASALMQRLAAELLVYWDRPGEGWALLDASLPQAVGDAIATLRRFADRAGQLRTPEGYRARGFALERLAQLAAGPERMRARLEAAQAFAAAGELGAAQRMLERLPERGGRADADVAAATTLIHVMIDAGRLDEAEAQLAQWRDRLRLDDLDQLREKLARARVLRGDFDRAEAILGPDSTVRADAVRGWIALYRGELAQARERFRAAGPQAPTREEATRRTLMLVLLERLEATRSPELGRALLRLERGDTARAVEALERVARAFPVAGRAAILALAGGVALSGGSPERATPLLEAAIAADEKGPSAPQAHLTLANAYAALGRREAAVQQLEHLILTFPESAVLPQARRLLEQLRGMIPRS